MKPLGIFLSSSRLPEECLKRVCDLTDRSSRCWSGWPARRSKSFLAREPSSRCSGLRGCGRGDLHCWKGLGLVRRRRHDCLHRDRDCESDLARFEILNSQQLKDSLLKLDSIFAAVRVPNPPPPAAPQHSPPRQRPKESCNQLQTIHHSSLTSLFLWMISYKS